MMDDFSERGLHQSLVIQEVPEHIREGLLQWVRVGRPVGGFLTAVLENNFKMAATRADITNRFKLYEIAIWVINCTPGMCQGSVDAVRKWGEWGGLEGLARSSAEEMEGSD